MTGYCNGYSNTISGHRVSLDDTVITYVQVRFDETISERSANYFAELNQATIITNPEERSVSNFNWLEGQYLEGLLIRSFCLTV